MRISIYLLFFALFFNQSEVVAQTDSLNARHYGFQIFDFMPSNLLVDNGEMIHQISTSRPLYLGYSYEVTIYIKGNGAMRISESVCTFDVELHLGSSEARFANDKNIIKSREIMPRIGGIKSSTSLDSGFFTFLIEPDKNYDRIAIVLDPRYGCTKGVDYSKQLTGYKVESIHIRPMNFRDENSTDPRITKIISSHENRENRVLIESTAPLNVTSPQLSISVYDHKTIDQDIVSIYLNEQKVIDNYTLKRKKKKVIVNLEEGENIILLHAENLGTIIPNTAAVVIESEDISIEKILTSDMDGSAYFKVIYTPE